MSLTAPQTRIDPLHAFIAGGFVAGTPRPVPLVATRFDVLIDGGLAMVTTSRTFRNAEPESIEATITFPVPIHATLFALKARIGDRVLEARARRKDAARADYEDALERGKTAVLHEEVLRGVHMLSVGHVAPGAEIEVLSSFAVALTDLDGRGMLRIPLTVGDIYGRSGLPDSDDLAHGGTLPPAHLKGDCRGGRPGLIRGALEDGRAQIRLDAEIGGSVDRVRSQSKARDVLRNTDGKSDALDGQALAQRGRRISVVLVGEDSLEANVGHLAALTGGEIFVATSDDLVAALEGAVR